MLYNDDKYYRIPKQFNLKLVALENTLIVTSEIAGKMNEEYRRNCEIHDAIDKESRIVADSIYAEA